MELAENIVNDSLLIFHREHPNTEVLGVVFLPELLAGKSEKRKRDLITVLLVVRLGDANRLLIE